VRVTVAPYGKVAPDPAPEISPWEGAMMVRVGVKAATVSATEQAAPIRVRISTRTDDPDRRRPRRRARHTRGLSVTPRVASVNDSPTVAAAMSASEERASRARALRLLLRLLLLWLLLLWLLLLRLLRRATEDADDVSLAFTGPRGG